MLISLEGKGGHGAMSHKAVDTIVPLAFLVMSLQTIVSMEFDARSDVVLTVGRIFSGPNETIRLGECYNVVAGNSYLEGTLRTFNDADTERFREKILRMIAGIETLYGVKGELYFDSHAPAVFNDPHLAELGKETCLRLWGEEGLDHELGKCMGAEDFANYGKKVPSMMVFVGGRNEKS